MCAIRWTAALAVFALSTALAAQGPPEPKTQREEMKKLEWLVGKWKGTGWMDMGPGKRATFDQTEKVESRAGGLVLVIEGEGRSEGKVVHSALAVASFDAAAKGFRFRAYDGYGRYLDLEAKVGEGTFEWGYREPQRGMQMRYTIRRNEKGEWFEEGEGSMDGKTWRKFFEMRLERER